MAGTLYTYPDSFRAAKALIAAQYSGKTVTVVSEPPQFVLGETNKTSEFLTKFPLGKVPAFECTDGTPIYESNAIAYYLANSQLRGGDADGVMATLVQQYVNFADNEILPPACTWAFPTLGIMQYNKQNTEAAQASIKKVLTVLNDTLATRTFLVGERVTLADISCACTLLLLYKQVLEPSFREPYVNVNRWFITCINQPQFKEVLGDVELCTKMATFDAKKYNELFPKAKKEPAKKEPAKKVNAPKNEQPKKKEPEPEEEEDVPKPAAKFIDPLADLKPSSFNLDGFKRLYSNSKDIAGEVMPWLWENMDREGWSLWKADYDYNEDLKMVFMASNLVSGMFQRLDKFRKHGFSSVLILGKDGDIRIEGVWLMRGQKQAFGLCEDWNVDAESYTFRKLDPDSKEDKATVSAFFTWEGDFGGREIADGKNFK